jgi:hypothetical protein
MGSIYRQEPTLYVVRDWCQQQADDPLCLEHDRKVWQLLADEYTARIGDKHEYLDEPLF